jgi:hypothetical protein
MFSEEILSQRHLTGGLTIMRRAWTARQRKPGWGEKIVNKAVQQETKGFY